MGTPCRIGYLENGKYSSIYCNFDGDTKNAGALLNTFFTTTNCVKALVNHCSEELEKGTLESVYINGLGQSVNDTRYCCIEKADRTLRYPVCSVLDIPNTMWDEKFVYIFDTTCDVWYYAKVENILSIGDVASQLKKLRTKFSSDLKLNV